MKAGTPVGGEATGTHEMRGEGSLLSTAWGLPGFLGINLGTDFGSHVGGGTDAQGCRLGQAAQPMLQGGLDLGLGREATRPYAHTVGTFANQCLPDFSSQGLLSLTPAATSSCWDFFKLLKN